MKAKRYPPEGKQPGQRNDGQIIKTFIRTTKLNRDIQDTNH